MMRFGRIFAVLAMLVLQPVAILRGGDCPHVRVDAFLLTAGGNVVVAADNEPGAMFSEGDDGLWAAAVTPGGSYVGGLNSVAAGSQIGESWLICPSGAYLVQGNSETLTQGTAQPDADPSANAGHFGPVPNVLTTNGTDPNPHAFLIVDDGDNVVENCVTYGDITFDLSGFFSGTWEGFGTANIQVEAPGVAANITVNATNAGVVVNGAIDYVDQYGNFHSFDPNDHFNGTTVALTIQTSAPTIEGQTYTVWSNASSGYWDFAWSPDDSECQMTSMVGWEFRTIAP